MKNTKHFTIWFSILGYLALLIASCSLIEDINPSDDQKPNEKTTLQLQVDTLIQTQESLMNAFVQAVPPIFVEKIVILKLR